MTASRTTFTTSKKQKGTRKQEIMENAHQPSFHTERKQSTKTRTNQLKVAKRSLNKTKPITQLEGRRNKAHENHEEPMVPGRLTSSRTNQLKHRSRTGLCSTQATDQTRILPRGQRQRKCHNAKSKKAEDQTHGTSLPAELPHSAVKCVAAANECETAAGVVAVS